MWLRPTNDFMFKYIFGHSDPDSKEILLAFLNDLFKLPKPQRLQHLEILNPTIDRRTLRDKSSVLDIHAKTTGGIQINVEVQNANEYNIDKRSLYYGAKIYGEQLSRGDDYRLLRKVVTVNILNFRYFEGNHYHRYFTLIDPIRRERYSDLLELHFIELQKFKKTLFKEQNRLAKWLLFITNDDDNMWVKIGEYDPIMKKAVERLRAASYDSETRRQYEIREKALKDLMSIKKGATEQGIKQGIEQGIEQGKEEALIEVAIQMLRRNVGIKNIMEFTKLPKETIEELKKNEK